MNAIAPSSTHRACAACMTTFKPLRPEHTLCRKCWSWIAAAKHVRILMRQLAEARA